MTRTRRVAALSLVALLPLSVAAPAHALTLPDLSSSLLGKPHPPAPTGNVPSALDNDPRCQVGFEDNFASHIAKIAPPSDHTVWEPTGEMNFNVCRDLSYVKLREVTKAYPVKEQFLLFHRGQFIGTTLEQPHQLQVVRRADDSTLTVDYYYWRNSQQDPGLYAGALTFRWDGEKVVTDGKLPDDYLGGAQAPSLPALSSLPR